MNENRPCIEIPHEALSPTALRGVIESFVLREGTDYGERELSFDRKVAAVVRQLERGEARILYDPVSETVEIVPRVGHRSANDHRAKTT